MIGILHDLGDRPGIAGSLGRFPRTLAVAERADVAARLLSSSGALREEIGSASMPWVAKMNKETLTTIRKRLAAGAFHEAWEQGRRLTIDEAVAVALRS